MGFVRILLFSTIVCAFSPCLAAPRKNTPRGNSAAVDATERLTRLRAGTPAFVTVSTRRGRELKHVNVEVKNAGQVRAQGVEVRVEFSGGLAYALRGARSLEPGQAGLYVLKGATSTVAGSSPRVIAQCSNCRR